MLIKRYYIYRLYLLYFIEQMQRSFSVGIKFHIFLIDFRNNFLVTELL